MVLPLKHLAFKGVFPKWWSEYNLHPVMFSPFLTIFIKKSTDKRFLLEVKMECIVIIWCCTFLVIGILNSVLVFLLMQYPFLPNFLCYITNDTIMLYYKYCLQSWSTLKFNSWNPFISFNINNCNFTLVIICWPTK